MTTRPPGLVTRYSSARAAEVSWTLRSPKEIVTASKVSSRNGSRIASPAVNGIHGWRALPTWSMPSEKSQGTTYAPARAKGCEEVAVPAARSRIFCAGRASTARATSLRHSRAWPSDNTSLVRS